MKLIAKPITVWGRTLSPPHLRCKNGIKCPIGGLWTVRPDFKVLRSVGRRRWAWIWVDITQGLPSLGSRKTKHIRHLTAVFSQMGVFKEAAVSGVRVSLGSTSSQGRIDNILKAMTTKHDISLVVVVLPDACIKLST